MHERSRTVTHGASGRTVYPASRAQRAVRKGCIVRPGFGKIIEVTHPKSMLASSLTPSVFFTPSPLRPTARRKRPLQKMGGTLSSPRSASRRLSACELKKQRADRAEAVADQMTAGLNEALGMIVEGRAGNGRPTSGERQCSRGGACRATTGRRHLAKSHAYRSAESAAEPAPARCAGGAGRAAVLR